MALPIIIKLIYASIRLFTLRLHIYAYNIYLIILLLRLLLLLSLDYLYSSADYGATWSLSVAYSNGVYFNFGGLAMSSTGSNIIAALLGYGK